MDAGGSLAAAKPLRQSLSILFGRYDLNSEFNRMHAGDLFFNSAFGTDTDLAQSGQAGPSIFPNTALGGRLEAKPLDALVLRVAVLDGVPVDRPGGWDAFADGDGLLVVAEAAFLYRPADTTSIARRPCRFLVGRNTELRPYQAKIALGAWHYTASFADLSDLRVDGQAVNRTGNTGVYLIGETVVQQNGAGGELRVFGKAGAADARVNRSSAFLAGGITAKGYVPARPNDEFGFGFVAAINGNHYLEAERRAGRAPADAEVAIELPYLAALTSWLSIEPDLQYVINPNTDSRLHNAFVALVRVELSF